MVYGLEEKKKKSVMDLYPCRNISRRITSDFIRLYFATAHSSQLGFYFYFGHQIFSHFCPNTAIFSPQTPRSQSTQCIQEARSLKQSSRFRGNPPGCSDHSANLSRCLADNTSCQRRISRTQALAPTFCFCTLLRLYILFIASLIKSLAINTVNVCIQNAVFLHFFFSPQFITHEIAHLKLM